MKLQHFFMEYSQHKCYVKKHNKKVHQLLAHINKYKGTPVDIGSLTFATVNVYYVMGFRPNYFTCIAHLYLYYTLLVPHTYVSYIRH